MEELVFWLVPVILLVVFTVVLTNHTREPKRRKLLFVEPLGTLVKKWRPVRFVGDVPALQETLKWLIATCLDDGAPLEMVLSLDQVEPGKMITLIERERLGAWAEQRVVHDENRTVSLVAGDVTSVLVASRYRSDGRTLLNEDDRSQAELTATRAGEHGYLALAVARRHFHSRVIEAQKHTWLGMILLEPIIDESLRHQLGQLAPGRRKFLSVLPDSVLRFLSGKLGQSSQFAGVPTNRTHDPLAQEEEWEQAATIGQSSPEQRHAVVRYFESRRDCRLLSVLPQDQALPVQTTDRL